MISIDAIHLYDKYIWTMLVIAQVDTNDQLFPLIILHYGGKNNESWVGSYGLHSCEGGLRPNLCTISDRHRAFLVVTNPGHAHHRFYLWHLASNFLLGSRINV